MTRKRAARRWPSSDHGKTEMLRRNAPKSERLLWSRLSGCQLGVLFHWNTRMGPYFPDFQASMDVGDLVIEVDGSSHQRPGAKERDEERDKWMRDRGVTVQRFTAHEVLRDTDGVVAAITDYLERNGIVASGATRQDWKTWAAKVKAGAWKRPAHPGKKHKRPFTLGDYRKPAHD